MMVLVLVSMKGDACDSSDTLGTGSTIWNSVPGEMCEELACFSPRGAPAAVTEEQEGMLGRADEQVVSVDTARVDGGVSGRPESGVVDVASPPSQVMGCWPFPDSECETLWRVEGCESGHGTNLAAYNTEAENGGRLQINRASWKDYFWETYGWHWADIVQDDNLNRVAAYVIWQRAGNSWSPWACY